MEPIRFPKQAEEGFYFSLNLAKQLFILEKKL